MQQTNDRHLINHPPTRLYRLRTVSSLPVSTAVRARCLAGGQDALTLFVAPDGTPQALDYAVGACHSPTAAAHQFPATTPVHVGRAEVVANPPLMPRTQPKAPIPAHPTAQPGAKGEAVPPPPPEDKTWLQKNWIYLIPLFFVGTRAL